MTLTAIDPAEGRRRVRHVGISTRNIARLLYATLASLLAFITFIALHTVLFTKQPQQHKREDRGDSDHSISSWLLPCAYFAFGPFLAVIHLGHFSLLSPSQEGPDAGSLEWTKTSSVGSALGVSLESGLMAAKGWPHLATALLLHLTLRYVGFDEDPPRPITASHSSSTNALEAVPENLFSDGAKFSTLLGLVIIALAVAVLATVVLLVMLRDAEAVSGDDDNKASRPCERGQQHEDESYMDDPSAKSENSNDNNNGKENRRGLGILRLYAKDNRLHLILPMAFFVGLHEAFMARDFLAVSRKCKHRYIERKGKAC